MKLLIATMLLLSQVSFATEVTPETFIGKYVGISGECEGTRVYISKETDTLDIIYYRDDVSGYSIRLENGLTKSPITKTVVSWTSWTEKSKFHSEETYETPSMSGGKLKGKTESILFLLRNGNVLYERYETGTSLRSSLNFCELERQ